MGERVQKSDIDLPLNAEALAIMRYATVAGLKSDAIETAQLFADLDEHARKRLLILLDL